MTVHEMLEQAKTLSAHDRKHLAILLIDTLDIAQTNPPETEPEHWGKSLNQLLDTLDMSDWQNMTIDDSVAWVESIRNQEAARLSDYWQGIK